MITPDTVGGAAAPGVPRGELTPEHRAALAELIVALDVAVHVHSADQRAL
ncbi:MAG: hypothetical protein ACRDR6_30170 [Pseudonocardiaceae bacterium]